MERPVSAPGGVSARRNQILERPVLAHRRRAHAPPGSVTIIFIMFTGTLMLASLNDPYHHRLLTSSPLDPQTTLTAHTPKHVPILAGDSSATSSATATKRGASASSSTARADKLLFPRVVRRVQAVIEVPVKVEEEEEGDGDGEANRVDWPDSTVPQPTSTPTNGINGAVAGTGTGTGGRGGTGGSAKRHKSSASSHQRRRSIIVPPSDDEERRSLVEGEEEPPSEHEEEEEEGDDGSGEYVDEEEVENAIVNGTPSAAAATTGGGQKTAFPKIPWGRKHIGHQPDEEDDELMMYAKV
jgi:hypothetical protein